MINIGTFIYVKLNNEIQQSIKIIPEIEVNMSIVPRIKFRYDLKNLSSEIGL